MLHIQQAGSYDSPHTTDRAPEGNSNTIQPLFHAILLEQLAMRFGGIPMLCGWGGNLLEPLGEYQANNAGGTSPPHDGG